MGKWHIETSNGNTQVDGDRLHLKDTETGSPANVFITDEQGAIVFSVSQHSLVYVKQLGRDGASAGAATTVINVVNPAPETVTGTAASLSKCPQCFSTQPHMVGQHKETRKVCRDPFHCTNDHANMPFRYCPDCTWTEADA